MIAKSRAKTLSVVTISYNSVDDLQRTMLSVKKQKWEGLEYILVDGGSTDGSRELFCDPVFDIVSRGPDKGIYDAMNRGASLATGEVIIFMNSGDEFYPQLDLRLLLSSVSLKVPFVGFSIQRYKKLEFLRPSRARKHELRETPPHQSFFMPKAIYKNSQFSLNEPLSADTKWMRDGIALAGLQLTDEIVSIFHLGGISNGGSWKTVLLSLRERRGVHRHIMRYILMGILPKAFVYCLLYRRKYDRIK